MTDRGRAIQQTIKRDKPPLSNRGKSDAAKARQLDGRPPQVDTKHRAKEIDFEALDPADGQA